MSIDIYFCQIPERPQDLNNVIEEFLAKVVD